MWNKRKNKEILILIVFILILVGNYNYAGATSEDIESPTPPSNLQLMLDDEQIDLGQNQDANKNEKYKKYNKWINSLKEKLKGYNTKPKLKLYWQPASDNVKVEGYKVFRNGIEIGTTELTAFIDENFSESTVYNYYVIAFDASMNLSKPSNIIKISTQSQGEPNEEYTDAKPANTAYQYGYFDSEGDVDWYTVSIPSTSTLTVSLDTLPNGVDANIEIYNSTLSQKYSGTLQNGIKTANTGQTTPGTYYIRVYDISGFSLTSQYKIKILATGVDAGLSFIKQNSGAALNWNKINGYSSYNIYRKTSPNGTFSKIAQSIANTYIDNSLVTGTTYNYEIGYVNDSGFEIISSAVEAYYSNGTNVSGVLMGDHVWTSASSPYIIQDSVTIPLGSLLKIMPGTVIKFGRIASLILDGDIEAFGTLQYPIVFTSDTDSIYGGNGIQEYSSWGSIVIGNGGSFTGDYTNIKYGGNIICNYPGMLYVKGKLTLTNSQVSDYYTTGIYLENSGLITIKNNSITSSARWNAISIVDGSNMYYIENNTITTNSKNYGIYIRRYSIYLPNRLSIKNNIINTGRYGIAILLDSTYGELSAITSGISKNTFYPPNNTIGLVGSLRSNLTIPKGIFMVEGGTIIDSSATLTLSPGTVLKLTGYENMYIYGKFIARGTEKEPIVITAENDNDYGGHGISSNWDYFCIKIESTGEFIAEHAKIKYGGCYQTDLNFGAGIYSKGTLNIINSEISNSYGTGIYYSGGIIKLVLNTFKNNNKYAIYSNGGMINAAYNYWEGSSGPGLAQNAVHNVICTPWLGGQYDTQLHFGEESNFSGGNFSRSFSDMTMYIPSFQLNIGRTYNSRDSRNASTLGRGWVFSLEGSIKDYGSADTKVVRLPNGSIQNFYFDGYSYSASDSRNKLTLQDDGTFVLSTKDQYKYGFNKDGYIVWMKDRNDNTVTISVDYNGKVTAVTDAAGRKINVSYNPQGMINIITDSIGRSVRYDYTNGRLVKVTDPAGKVANYVYDTYGYLSEIRDGAQSLVESIEYNHISDENNEKIIQTSDAFGNVFSYKYDNQNRTTTVTDSNGRQTITEYDILGYPIKFQDYEGKITLTEYYVEYNGMNKYGEEKSVTDRNGNTTQYLRDYWGNVTKIINPDGSFKENLYDQKNNIISQKDENGKYIFYVYDVNGVNLLKKVQPLNGVDQYSTTVDQSKFAITQYYYYSDIECQQRGYFEKGLLKSEIDPVGEITLYTYDSVGNIKTVTNPENKTTTNSYNQIGWKISVVSPKGYITAYSYDNDGRIVKTVLNNGETTRIFYDSEGRKIKEISPNLYNIVLDDATNHIYSSDCGYRYTYYSNGKVKSITDPENNITVYAYNLYGDISTETKPNGAIYQYEYDVMNRLSKVWFKENDLASPILQESYVYTILPDGKTQKIQTKYLNSTEKAVTTYTYDYADRLVEQLNPDGAVQKINYNSNGTVTWATDANGNTTYYAYDGLNRQTAKWTPFETVNGAAKYVYTVTSYDLAGRKNIETICKDKVDLNQVPTLNLITTNYDYFRDGKVKSIYDNEGRRKDFAYDDDGNLSKEDDYIDSVRANSIEYANNHLGKSDQKKVHVRKGDIFENDFKNNEDLILSTIYSYDKNGNLKTETGPDGVVTTYEYDNLNRQTKVSEPGQNEFGNTAEIAKVTTYNWDGKPVLVTDSNGNTTKHMYNQKGLLEKIIDAKGGIAVYYYDTAGRKIAEVSPRDYDSSKTLEQMNRTQYSYDLMDRLIAKTNIFIDSHTSQWVTINSKSYSYDNSGNILSETDALGNRTSYLYNFANKPVSVTDPVSKERGLAFTTKYEYDALGRKTSDANAAGVITLYYYDDAGNLNKTSIKKTTNALEQITQTSTYDFLGNVLIKNDANGNKATFEYNALGKVKNATYPGDASISTQTITYQYDALGNLKSAHDSTGTVDLFTYDNQDRELSHTQQAQDGSDAITTSIKYDKNGNKRFVTDGNGNTKENTFDELNRIKTTTVTVSEKNETTAFTYDENGNQLTITNWRGNTYSNIYDVLNRLIEKKDPNNKLIQKLEYNANNIQSKSYDALGNMTEYTYDKNNRLLSTIDSELHVASQTYDDVGNIKTKTDGKGNVTTFNYDEFNRLISVINANNEVTSYTYDLNGNMLTQTDAKGNKITYEYNVKNKPVNRSDGSQVREIYTYFADGNLKTKTDRNGNTVNYAYDSHDRMIAENVESISISYIFDGNGNRLSMIDSTGTTGQTFDELNRIKTKNTPNTGKISYVYDIISDIQDGNIKQSLTDSKGNVVEKVFDSEGRLKEVSTDGQTTIYDYYDNGSKKSITYPNGSKEEYTYYKDGLLNTLINKMPDGSIIDTYSYTYDSAHNQTSKTDNKGVTSYTYDKLNRLEGVTKPSGKVTTYTFDAAGNRASETVNEKGSTSVTSYTYNEQNRLLKTQTKTDGIITAEKRYTYDNNGNQLSESDESKNVVNTYDELNQLVTVVSNGTNVVNVYNGDGIRIAKSTNGQLVNYLYEGDKIILELDGSGNQKARNVQGTNLISRQIDGQNAYYFYNGHGDVTSLIDSKGQVLATYYYNAFGNFVESNGTIDNPFRFSGYQYDPETGDYYLMSRMYDPEAARFLQEDSFRGDKNDPLSLNLYTYCHNEPVMYTDPTGHWAEDGSDKKYKRYSSIYSKLAKLTSQYENAVSDEEKNRIATSAKSLRGVADIQIKLRQLNYAGANGKLLDVDGTTGENTATAINYFTLKSKMSIFGKNRRDIDGATYNAIMGAKGASEVQNKDNGSEWNNSSLNLVYYNQADAKWGSIKYSSFNDDRWKTANGGKPQNIAGTGCGPTSMAMVISSFTGQDVTPNITVDDAITGNYRTQYNGTTAKFFTEEVKQYNLEVRSTRDIQEVKTALNNGNHLVIASMGPGHFTGGGHYIVLSDLENDGGVEKIVVLDPNMNNGRYKKYNDKAVELTDSKGIVKANVETISKEVNSVGYFIYSR